MTYQGISAYRGESTEGIVPDLPPLKKVARLFCTRTPSDKENYTTISFMVKNANNPEATQYKLLKHTPKGIFEIGQMPLEDRLERLRRFVKRYNLDTRLSLEIVDDQIRMVEK